MRALVIELVEGADLSAIIATGPLPWEGECILVYMSKQTSGVSTVLTIRVTPDLNRRLARAARTSRRTRSETARAILETALAAGASQDPTAEARRQSKLASVRASDRGVLTFITTAADLRGWR